MPPPSAFFVSLCRRAGWLWGRRCSPLLRWAGVALLLAYFSFGSLLLVLRYSVLPRIDEYRPLIVAEASARLGQKIDIESIEADWSGLRPRLHLAGVRVGGAGSDSLRLERVDAVLSWRSLLSLRPDFHRLELFGPSLMLRRDGDGRLHVAGVLVPEGQAESGESGGEGAALDWLLGQRELVIRQARVRWLDQLRKAPELVMEDVNFRLLAGGGRYRFGFTARPPARLASAIDLRGELRGRDPAHPQTWSGDIYAALDGGDLGGLTPWVDYPLPLRGSGGGRLWLRVADGRISNALVDLGLRDVAVQFAPELEPLRLESARGRLSAALGDGSSLLSAQGLQVRLGGGAALGPVDFQLRRQAAGWSRGMSTQLRFNRMDVAFLARVAAHLPLEAGWRTRLAELAPAGVLRAVDLQWEGDEAAPVAWQLQARFEDLAMNASGALPGVHGLSGEIRGNEASGQLHLRGRGMALDLPQVFPEPRLALDHFEAEAGWTRDGAQMGYQLQRASFANGDAAGSAWGTFRSTGQGLGSIDLRARLDRANGNAVWRYMPHVVNADTRNWLRAAIVAGTAHETELHLQGDLDRFPFRDGSGVFRITSRIADARLEYAPGWPAIDGIQGGLRFEGAEMEITARRGLIYGVQLSEVSARLPDLEAPEEILTIRGKAAGPTGDFLRFVTNSPVAERIGHFTDEMRAAGDGRLDLKLVMPLRHVRDTGVTGSFRFAGNRLWLVPGLPVVADAAGTLRFSAEEMNIPAATGRFLGEPMELSAATEEGQVRFRARGRAAALTAREELGWPWLDHLSGNGEWQADIDVLRSGARVAVRSGLQGISSSLPYPFNKGADAEMPLEVRLDFPGEGRNDRLHASLGGFATVALERNRASAPAWGAARGGIGLFTPVRVVDGGVMVAAALERLDVDGWRKALGRGGGGGAGADGAGGLPLIGMAIQAGELKAFGQSVRDFDLRAVAEADGWRGRLKSTNAAGEFSWDAREKGSFKARFAHLVVDGDPAGEAVEGAEGPEEPPEEAPSSLPALDIRVDRFVLRGMPLGRLELQARNRSAGRWDLEALRIETPRGVLAGQGSWRARSPQQTRLGFTLDTPDAGHLLTELGFANAMQHGSTRLAGEVSWAGAPTRIDYPSLGGELQLEVGEGQFRKLDPGVGRLLGVLSLQALPRRITLDFRDVFSEGFAFDRISGTIKIAAGVMHTEDLQIRGPAARVFMRGSADIPRESQDLRVTVQPTLSESVAIGAAAGLINPVAGVVTYLAQKVLSDPIEKLFSFEYTVTGGWADPKVDKLGQGAASAQPGAGPGDSKGRREQ